MPYLAQKLHLGRVKWIVLGEFELRGEDAAFKGRAFGALDQCLPGEEIVFINGACGDAVGWGGEEGFVFGEEALGCHA
jgi:hypothetical protein